jgi:hypothetical protein
VVPANGAEGKGDDFGQGISDEVAKSNAVIALSRLVGRVDRP